MAGGAFHEGLLQVDKNLGVGNCTVIGVCLWLDLKFSSSQHTGFADLY